MKIKIAVDALASLAQETRLAIFRLLVRTGPEGMAAGDLALALDVPGPTLSFHLAHLTRAGMLECRREGRSLIYAAHFDGVRALLHYLTEDCCQGKPELCGDAIVKAACVCPPVAKARKAARTNRG